MLKINTLSILLCCCLSAHTQTPSFSWVKPVHGATQTANLAADISDLDADPAGNTYITGHFQGQLNFGGGITLSGNGPTLFLAKYGPDGTLLWAKKAAPVAPDDVFPFGNSSKIAVDAAGNVYWCANYRANALDFDNGITITRTCTNGCQEGFLLKLSTDGSVVFQKAIKAATGETLHLAGVAADSAGRHYLTGSYSGTELWLQGGANIGGLTTQGYFLGAYAVAGNAEWIAFQAETSGRPFADAIAVSPDGERIVVTGFYDDTQLNFSNGATTTSNAVEKKFAVWYNTIGQPMGAGTLASDQPVDVFDIRLDEQDRLWAACNYAGALDWNQQTLAAAPASPSAGAIAILSPNENGILALSIPHTLLSQPVTTLTLGPGGAFFAGGLSGESLSVPGVGPLANNGCLDAILISGIGQTPQLARNIGGAGCEKIDNFSFGSHMDTDAAGNLLVCGTFENGGIFGVNSLNGNGLWVAKINTGVVSVDNPAAAEVRISPNPAGETVQVIFPENGEGVMRISSITGKVMVETGVQPRLFIKVSDWPAGIYIVEYQNVRGSRVAGKVIVQH